MKKKIVGNEKLKKGTKLFYTGSKYVYVVTSDSTEPGFADVKCIRDVNGNKFVSNFAYNRQAIKQWNMCEVTGKATPKQQIAELTEACEAKDKEIARLKSVCEEASKQRMAFEKKYWESLNEKDKTIRELHDSRGRHEARASELSIIVAHQKEALALAGKTITTLSNAAR